MIKETQILTRADMEVYKKIADSFKNIDTSKMSESVTYLKEYIRKNENTTNPEIAKKVACAKKLAESLSSMNKLRDIKSDMDLASGNIESDLKEAPEKTEFQVNAMYIGTLNAYQNLEKANPDEILTLWNEFMEGDNFAEYKIDSPVRFLGEFINACKSAYNGFQQIEANVNRREYETVIENNNIVSTKFEEINAVNQAMSENDKISTHLTLAYGGDVDLEKLSDEQKKTDDAIKQYTDEINKLSEKYTEVSIKEEEAKQTLPQISRSLTALEEQYKKETQSSVSGDARKQANKDKTEFKEALLTLSKAHNDIITLRKENPQAEFKPFELAESKAKKHENALKSLDEYTKQVDTDSFINTLVENEPNKELAKKTLQEAFDYYRTGKAEENRWLTIQNKYTTYKNAFGENPDFMNYLIAEDDDVMVAGYKKLEERYGKSGKAEDKALLDMAISLKKEIFDLIDDKVLVASYFGYDGKSPQAAYLKELEDRIQTKVDGFTNGRGSYPLERAYNGYVNTKKSLESTKKQLEEEVKKGQAANPELINNLGGQLSSITQKNMEYWARLKGLGIENIENIEKIRDYAQKRATLKDADLSIKQTEVLQAKRIADMSKEYADKLKKAVSVVSKSEFAKNDPGLKCLLDIINNNQPDYSKLPENNTFLSDINVKYAENVEKNLNNLPNVTKEKLDAVREKYNTLAAVSDKKESEKLLEEIAGKKTELDTLLTRKQKLDEKKNLLTKAVDDYKKAMEKPIADFEKKYNEYPNILSSEEEYRKIYKQIERFRNDYNKCRRSDYIDGSKQNSNEYQNIKTALDTFGDWEKFKKMPAVAVASGLLILGAAADAYKAKKLKETRPFWSAQRRYRLGYADRIKGFANTEKVLIEEYLSNIDEKKALSDLEKTHQLVEKANPALFTDQDIINGLTRPAELKKEADYLKKADARINETLTKGFALINNYISKDKLNSDVLKNLLIIYDTVLEQKERLYNPVLLKEKGAKNLAEEVLNNISSKKVQQIANDITKDAEKNREYDEKVKGITREDIIDCKNVKEFLDLIKKNAFRKEIKNATMEKVQKELSHNMEKVKEGDATKIINNDALLRKNPVKKPAPKPFNG